jgi:hypothetical protein
VLIVVLDPVGEQDTQVGQDSGEPSRAVIRRSFWLVFGLRNVVGMFVNLLYSLSYSGDDNEKTMEVVGLQAGLSTFMIFSSRQALMLQSFVYWET